MKKNIVVARNEKYAVNKLEHYHIGDIYLCLAKYDTDTNTVDDTSKIQLLGPSDIHEAFKNTIELFPTIKFDIGVCDETIYCVTNTIFHEGAVNVFFPNTLKEIAEEFDSDLHLVFLSTHEAMVHSTKTAELEDLYEVMHKTMDDNGVKDKNRLTDLIYTYHKDINLTTSTQK